MYNIRNYALRIYTFFTANMKRTPHVIHNNPIKCRNETVFIDDIYHCLVVRRASKQKPAP